MSVSPAQRAQRRAAGKSSGKSRGTGTTSDDEPQGDPDAPMPVTHDPEVDDEMAAYDLVVGKPMSWPDVKNRVQTRAEIYRTRAAARADRVESGALLTRDQVRTRDERAVQVFCAELQTINQQLTALVPADRLLAAQGAMREWIDGVLNKVADAIEGEK